MSEGYIYVLFNPAFRGDQYKIGQTTKKPEVRAKEISAATGVPQDFEVLYEERVVDCVTAERLIHQRLNKYRSASNREFFQLPLKTVIKTIDEVAKKVGRFQEPNKVETTTEPTPDGKDPNNISGEINVVVPRQRLRSKSKPDSRSPASFEKHASYTDEPRRKILTRIRQHILSLDDRLRDGEVCTPGQRVAYKVPGYKIFLEVNVQRSAIVLHLIDANVPDPNGVTTPIPESHGWGDLKKRIKISTSADAEIAIPFIEAAYRVRLA